MKFVKSLYPTKIRNAAFKEIGVVWSGPTNIENEQGEGFKKVQREKETIAGTRTRHWNGMQSEECKSTLGVAWERAARQSTKAEGIMNVSMSCSPHCQTSIANHQLHRMMSILPIQVLMSEKHLCQKMEREDLVVSLIKCQAGGGHYPQGQQNCWS